MATTSAITSVGHGKSDQRGRARLTEGRGRMTTDGHGHDECWPYLVLATSSAGHV